MKFSIKKFSFNLFSTAEAFSAQHLAQVSELRLMKVSESISSCDLHKNEDEIFFNSGLFSSEIIDDDVSLIDSAVSDICELKSESVA